MKNTLAYLLLGLFTMALSSFNERPAKPVVNRVMTTKYIYHYSIYEGKWLRNKSSSERVFFITDVISYNCETSSDCDDAQRRIKDDFIKQLTDYEVSRPSVTPEYFSEKTQAEQYRRDRIRIYKNYGRRIIEI